MTYDIFSIHAHTGESATKVVSSNQYSTQGRTIGYPTNLDLYARLLSDADGSQAIRENRKVSDLIGSRLYLYHRPLINTDGSVTTITSSQGTIDTSFTNASQAYIVFSSLPTSDFTISYIGTPDCDFTWNINTLQDSVMELERVLGPTNDSTYPGLRNLKIATFDTPTGETASGVLLNAVHVSHLNQNIVFASSDDTTLQVTRGTNHTIQIGRTTDNVIIDATGFTISQTDGTKTNKIVLGTKTGDYLNWKGQASGAGPLTLGGAEWPTFSGKLFSTEMTGTFYTGAMLKVHGDVAVMGGIRSIGTITVVNTTGTTSTILGDFTVRDELFVEGITHLIGVAETNRLNVHQNLHIDSDIIAGNVAGQGSQGQSLVDNLDCSEVAWSYSTITKAKHANSIISAPLNTGMIAPKKLTYRPWMTIEANHLVGDVFSVTGGLNANAGPSGEHPNILQLLLNVPIVTGTYVTPYGFHSGTWSPGMMEPGNMWIKLLTGPARNLSAPIYGYTVEATGTPNLLTRLNVFIPDLFSSTPQTNNKYLLYNPYSVLYDTVRVEGGASPTFSINATTDEPLAISFEDKVRIMTSNSASYSLLSALTNSISGQVGTPLTGIAYVFADSNNTDPEDPPIFKARSVPFRMPGQTSVGEVVATYDGATWSVLDTISYRPNGMYDSAWIPIDPNTGVQYTSGRVTPGFSSVAQTPMRVYFHHNLGSDVEIGRINANLYLGSLYTGAILWNKTHTPMYSFFGQDPRNTHGLNGSFVHVPLGAKRHNSAVSERDASIYYLDSSLIGVDISPSLLSGFITGGSTPTNPSTYLRLIVNKQN